MDAVKLAVLKISRAAGLLALLVTWAVDASAQELSPRTFWPAPVGTKVLIAGYQYAEGDVLMDPSVPLYGVDSKIHSGILGYLQTFSLRGRTSNILIEVPYSAGTTRGLVGTRPAKRDFAGFSDPGITLTINLMGAKAMSPADFQTLREHPRPILGISLKLVPPLGHYEEGHLINVGANRWATLDANYFTGGRQTIGGDELIDLQSNRRFGATLVVPFRGRNALKFGLSTGTRTRYGNDFSQFLLTYQRVLK